MHRACQQKAPGAPLSHPRNQYSHVYNRKVGIEPVHPIYTQVFADKYREITSRYRSWLRGGPFARRGNLALVKVGQVALQSPNRSSSLFSNTAILHIKALQLCAGPQGPCKRSRALVANAATQNCMDLAHLTAIKLHSPWVRRTTAQEKHPQVQLEVDSARQRDSTLNLILFPDKLSSCKLLMASRLSTTAMQPPTPTSFSSRYSF